MVINEYTELSIKGNPCRVLMLQCDACGLSYSKQFKTSILAALRHYDKRECYAASRRRSGVSFKAASETSKKLYGVAHPMKSKLIQDKLENTFVERYGVKHNMHLKSTQDAKQATLDERYGGHQMYDKCVVAKVQATNMERYGVVTPLVTRKSLDVSHSQIALDKKFKTQKQNGTLARSRPELELEKQLIAYFGVENVKHSVRQLGFCIDFCVKHKNQDVYIQMDGVFWHGLDRSLEEIEKSTQLVDSAILDKFKRDRRADVAFKLANIKLIRVTDMQVNDKSAMNVIRESLNG